LSVPHRQVTPSLPWYGGIAGKCCMPGSRRAGRACVPSGSRSYRTGHRYPAAQPAGPPRPHRAPYGTWGRRYMQGIVRGGPHALPSGSRTKDRDTGWAPCTPPLADEAERPAHPPAHADVTPKPESRQSRGRSGAATGSPLPPTFSSCWRAYSTMCRRRSEDSTSMRRSGGIARRSP
jgi:hypothetical protein